MKRKDLLKVLAAVFATSNLGWPIPDSKQIKWAKESVLKFGTSHASLAVDFNASWIENDDMAKYVVKEARFWHNDLRKRSNDEIEKTWPDIWKAVTA